MANTTLRMAQPTVRTCASRETLARYFRITSRSHHGLVLLTEIARATAAGRPLSIRSVARSMRLSAGYLEELAALARAAGLIRGTRGRAGGYALVPPAAAVTVGAVVRLLDGPVVLAACQDERRGRSCHAQARCMSRSFFAQLKRAIDRELDCVTLADLVRGATLPV